MSPPRTQCSRLRGYTNDERKSLVIGQAQDAASTGNPTVAHQTVSHSRHGSVPCQDLFTYYNAFPDTGSPSTLTLDNVDEHNDGGTRCEIRSDAQSASACAEQQQTKPRSVPYSAAVRFSSRSNGLPLATIVEQGSISTLDSHGSLPSVGRFPAIRAIENASPGRASYRLTQSLDDGALNWIQEEEREQQKTCVGSIVDIQSKARRGSQSTLCNAGSTVAGLPLSENQTLSIPPLSDIDLEMETTGLGSFFRGVLMKVRSSTRNRSRSSSAGPPVLPLPGQRPDVNPLVQVDRKSAAKHDLQRPPNSISASTILLRSTPSSPHHASKHQATNGTSPKVKTKTPALASASTSHVSPSTYELEIAQDVPQLPSIPDLSRLQNSKEVPPSVCVVPPQPRDAALDYVGHTATTFLARSRDKLATGYTPGDAFAHRNDQWSLDDFTRNASHNASFCSTMSTSYSGTVLGIDLDLQHDLPHAIGRSVTPVWFSPMENVVTTQDPPNREPQHKAKQFRSHSMTSSALASLLPIATAEGIVQQDPKMPPLVFYSPSGNWIQARDASTTSTPASSVDLHFSGTPATTTSYYNATKLTSARSALSAAATIPPARPAPVPSTTPPQSIAPLPEHLRHHHNYQRVEKSYIGSTCSSELMPPSQVVTTSDSQVRGCGGMVRPTSLDPHSGVPQSPHKHSRIGHSTSCLRIGEPKRSSLNLRSLLASKPSGTESEGFASGKTVPRKGKTLKKRRLPRVDTVTEQSLIGPAAGHALRVCFCQPFDGVGRQTSAVGCGGAATTKLGEGRNKARACPTEQGESSTPNTRIVVGADRKGKYSARRDSVASATFLRD